MTTRSLIDLYKLWDRLANLPVGDDEKTKARLLHFPIGTPKEDIWHWFEAQHPADNQPI